MKMTVEERLAARTVAAQASHGRSTTGPAHTGLAKPSGETSCGAGRNPLIADQTPMPDTRIDRKNLP